MKKFYEEIKLEIYELSSADLIFTSDVEEDDNNGNTNSDGNDGSYHPSGNDSSDQGFSGYY